MRKRKAKTKNASQAQNYVWHLEDKLRIYPDNK